MYHGERFNSISHLVGAGLAVLGSVLLIVTAARLGDPWKIVSFSIYGAMLVTLYVFSTLYHSTRAPLANHISWTMPTRASAQMPPKSHQPRTPRSDTSANGV